MFLGALIGAGVPADLLHATVAALKLEARLEIASTLRSGLQAVKVDVLVQGEKDVPREVKWEKEAVDSPRHALLHGRDHGHAHAQEYQRSQPHETSAVAADENSQRAHASHHHHPEHGRSLKVIRQMITNAAIDADAKSMALAIFAALGAAEAHIHQVPAKDIVFHEVGSTDALVDIVCAAVGVAALRADRWVCSPLNVGGGTVQCAHGRFPVPAPATLELLKNCHAPVYSSGIAKELVTPTGAAIVSVLAHQFGSLPAMKVERTGYGAGYHDFPGHPNVLRLTLGEASPEAAQAAAPPSSAGVDTETVTILEANLDDISPQVVGYVLERLLAEGALDAFTAPLQMKKSRPGLLLTALCRPEDADRLAGLFFAETTTLGVRRRQETRQCLSRRHAGVQTPWGEVRIKLGSLGGVVMNCAPEYEDCRRLAAEHKVPLKTVMQEAVRLYRESHHE